MLEMSHLSKKSSTLQLRLALSGCGACANPFTHGGAKRPSLVPILLANCLYTIIQMTKNSDDTAQLELIQFEQMLYLYK